MIDGQQRVTAMMTALSGLEVFNADFEKKHIAIAYNPFAKNDEECFAVQDNAILKDKKWIPDISVIFQTSFDSFSFVQNFCETNPEITPKDFNQQITKLIDIKTNQISIECSKTAVTFEGKNLKVLSYCARDLYISGEVIKVVKG